MAAADSGVGGVASGDRWVVGQSPRGTYRLIRDGRPTTLTALVDRGKPFEAQERDLHDIEWVPPAVLAASVTSCDQTVVGRPEPPDLPSRWLAAPFPATFPQILLEGGEPRHPVRDWFWPTISNYGIEPTLEDDERMAEIVIPTSGSLAVHRDPGDAGFGEEVGPERTREERCFFTDRRVVRVVRRDPDSMSSEDQRVWSVSHLRWIWVHELGTLRATTIERRSRFSRARPGNELEAAYFRFRLPDLTTYELRIFMPDPQRFYDRALELCALDAERDVGQTREDVAQTPDAQIVRLATPVGGSVPHSMPESLEG